jgi:hypothetical protein
LKIWVKEVEIKSSVSEGDVITFERKVRLYEKKSNIKIDKKIILTPFANNKAIEIAKSLDIEIIEKNFIIIRFLKIPYKPYMSYTNLLLSLFQMVNAYLK